MVAFLKKLFRIQLRGFLQQELECMDGESLRALRESERCRNDPELLVAVWSEIQFREQDLKLLCEPTIEVRYDGKEKDPAINAGSLID